MKLGARVPNIGIRVNDHHTRNRILSLNCSMVVPAQRKSRTMINIDRAVTDQPCQTP
jgi:hypothetical protein